MTLKKITQLLVCSLIVFVYSCVEVPESEYLKDDEPLLFLNKKGDYKLIHYSRKCDASEKYCANISLIPANDSLPDTEGNVFVFKSGNGLNAFLDTVAYSNWLNDSTLRITYNKNIPIVKRETRVNKFSIVYRTM
jgi:hypothetical protein